MYRLSFRVRNGTGRFPVAINHRQTYQNTTHHFVRVWCCVRYWIVDAIHGMCTFCLLAKQEHSSTSLKQHGVWVVVVCLFWSISTSSLHTLQCFQVWPIYPIVFRGPQKKPHLKTGFPLRCFQRLSLPYVANQRYPWRDNWHTRGTSVPVLSY